MKKNYLSSSNQIIYNYNIKEVYLFKTLLANIALPIVYVYKAEYTMSIT